MITELLSKRDEKKLVENFARKKLKHLKKADYKDRQKMARRLLNHGFTASVVYEVLDEK